MKEEHKEGREGKDRAARIAVREKQHSWAPEREREREPEGTEAERTGGREAATLPTALHDQSCFLLPKFPIPSEIVGAVSGDTTVLLQSLLPNSGSAK